jgi:hypothetical protein
MALSASGAIARFLHGSEHYQANEPAEWLHHTTELVVLGSYWGNLNGWWRVLTISLGFVAYVQLWASWWYDTDSEPKGDRAHFTRRRRR